jgi:hypothetical protein
MTFGNIQANTDIGNFPPSGDVLGDIDAQTIANKRINPRSFTSGNPSSLSPDINQADIICTTAQAQALTINAPSGTPVEGQMLKFRLLDNGSAHPLAFNSIFQDTTNISLPATTLGSTTVSLILTFHWDSSVSKWRLTAKVN